MSEPFAINCIKTLFFTLLFSKPAPLDASSPTCALAPPEHQPLSRQSSSSRSYDLQERRRTGNMTGAEQAKYQRIPTDESEAQTLASADLDGIKSESNARRSANRKCFSEVSVFSLSLWLVANT